MTHLLLFLGFTAYTGTIASLVVGAVGIMGVKRDVIVLDTTLACTTQKGTYYSVPIELYEFQAEDAKKLVDRNGRLIASEMGTGKTPLASAMDEMNAGSNDSSLVVAPMQTLEQWQDWLNEAGTDVVILDPKDRSGSFAKFKRLKGGAFLAHWEALRLMPELREIKWYHVIADEVHRAQNRKAQQTLALKRIKTGFKTGLSGTPVTGATDKFWSVLNWLYPLEWSSYWKYFEEYVDYELVYPQGYRKVKGPKNEVQLQGIIEPYYVRHLKKEQCCVHHPDGVMPYLPDKYYTKVNVDLTPQQRKAYVDMKKDMLAWVGAHEDSPLVASVVVAQMMRLQQFANAYATVTSDGVILTEPSSKADAVMQILEDNPDEAIVVFGQFNRFIHLLETRLQKAKIEYVVYTGETRKTREADKKRFINGDARVFLGNIAAGGVGLDGLQAVSSTVVFTDRLWSPALNNQAEDRLWREGQLNAVQVIDIMARDTVDLGRHQRLELKWSWIKQLLGS